MLLIADLFLAIMVLYSKTCTNRPLKNRHNKDLNDRRSKVLEYSANTFDLHKATIGL